MAGERVVDASVVAAALFPEALTTQARHFLLGTPALVAPDHLFAEVASVAAKKVWSGETTREIGARACRALRQIVPETVPSATLAARAFELAALHRVSAYDGLYLALAEKRGVPVYTFDRKLAEKAVQAGLGELVEVPRL